MARGWESKDVESQVEQKVSARAEKGRELSLEEAARQRQIEGLESSRDRVARDIEQTSHPRRKAQLEEALKFLEAQIAAL